MTMKNSLKKDKYKKDVLINKGRHSANNCLKYNTTIQKYMWKEKKPHFTIYVTKISKIISILKKAYKNEKENKITN